VRDQRLDLELSLQDGPKGERRPEGALLDPVMDQSRVDNLQ
jgi:hypothetical protein